MLILQKLEGPVATIEIGPCASTIWLVKQY